MGITEPKTIKRLNSLNNTEIKISYDSKSTRLHAKAYIFERSNGFTTAYIGSSNLSKAAVSDGMEWNIKVTNQDAPQVIMEMKAAFENYWNSPDFELYMGDEESTQKLLQATIDEGKHGKGSFDSDLMFDLRPHPFQEQILEKLRSEREINNNSRNLVVAATGTGKTMIAAFDFKRYRESHKGCRLLFVAHRKDIVEQSLKKFRHVLKDRDFGELADGDSDPTNRSNLFSTIQTFNTRYSRLNEYYDYIVIDEAHHIAADQYIKLIDHFEKSSRRPDIILGLTATPDRMDGASILEYFNNRISGEIGLAEAINREYLVPFQYYALEDETDISGVRYDNGKYDADGLTEAYIANKQRVGMIIDCLDKYCPDREQIRCIGFCATIEHAKFMTEQFNTAGRNSEIIDGSTSTEDRKHIKSRFADGRTNYIFAVNVLNEGVDIPEINTILFLRPTESRTIFVQQLGRGLRRADNKQELIALDFVGQYDKRYNVFEDKLRAICSCSATPLSKQIQDGFTGLPIGCYISLEKKPMDYILKKLNETKSNKKRLQKLFNEYISDGKTPSLKEFCRLYDVNPHDIYRSNVTFSELCDGKHRTNISASGLLRLCSIDSRRWILTYAEF